MLRKALAVDDDPVSLHILKTMLEKWDYRVTTASNGTEAFARYKEEDGIQMVISDWMMPVADGIDLCRLIRSLTARPYTYYILLTAKTQVQDIVEGIEAGADDFVAKPFDQNELKARIHAGERVLGLQNQLAAKVKELSNVTNQMRRDLEAAAAIQTSMLPLRDKAFPGLKYAYSYIPCDRIGGDFLNLVTLDRTRTGIYIFDVSGHGVPAALQSVALGRILSAYDPTASVLLKPCLSPNDDMVVPPRAVTNQLNSRFQFAASRGDFITFLYGVFNSGTMSFAYARAGHPAPILISKGKNVPINDEGGVPIGILAEPAYGEKTINLSKGDRLYLYTDGLTEAANSARERYGEDRVREYLSRAFNLGLQETIDRVVQSVFEWRHGETTTDDLTVLGLEVDC